MHTCTETHGNTKLNRAPSGIDLTHSRLGQADALQNTARKNGRSNHRIVSTEDDRLFCDFCASSGLDRLRPTRISCSIRKHVSLVIHQSILAIVLYDSTPRSRPRQGEVYHLAPDLGLTRPKAPEYAAPKSSYGAERKFPEVARESNFNRRYCKVCGSRNKCSMNCRDTVNEATPQSVSLWRLLDLLS